MKACLLPGAIDTCREFRPMYMHCQVPVRVPTRYAYFRRPKPQLPVRVGRRPAAQAAAIEKGGRFALVGRVQLSQFLHKIIGVLRSRVRCQRFRRFSFARARRPSAFLFLFPLRAFLRVCSFGAPLRPLPSTNY